MVITSGVCLAADDMESIEGSVWYRERMALPPNAGIQVFLEDVARMDVASEVIASTRIVPRGGPPWAFSLAYDPAKLNDKGRYVLRARIEADGKLMFINTQQIPAFEAQGGSPIKILVSRVGKTPPATTSTPIPDVSLANTYWKLAEIDGHPATLGAGERELNMVLVSDGATVRGFSGCNHFTGGYSLNENRLTLTSLASTNMACIKGMDQERRYLDALGKVVRFIISGDSLALFSGDEMLILRFNAVALK